MSYTTRAKIETQLPPQFILEACDDDKDGVEDAGLFDAILAEADGELNGILGQRFTVPFTGDLPPILPRAATLFVLETLYRRRGYGTEANPNPFTGEARRMREKLDRIARGEEPLAPEQVRTRPSVSLITEPSNVYSGSGNRVL